VGNQSHPAELGQQPEASQGAPAGGRHGLGADLRTGLSGLLVRFLAGAVGAPGREGSEALPQAGSFDFLGSTHFWSRSKEGFWVVKRKTAGSRFQGAIRKIADWCRLNRHLPLGEQHQVLGQKLRGH
jgi:hypothetical protein